MTLSRRTVILIVALLVTALVGLGIIQVLLLRQAVALRSEAFTRNVNGALVSVVEKLETREALGRALELTTSLPGTRENITGILSLVVDDSARLTTRKLMFRSSPDDPEVVLEDSTLVYVLPTPQRVRLLHLDDEGLEQRVLVDERQSPGTHRILLSQFELGSVRAMRLEFETAAYVILLGGLPDTIETPWLPVDLDRRVLVDRVLEDYFRPGPQSLQTRLEFSVLDSLVAATLSEYGLPAECSWGVIHGESDSLLYARPREAAESLRHSPYSTRLFPHDPIIGSENLVFHFPHRLLILAREVGPFAVVTLLFLLLIGGCFTVIFRVYGIQRRFSQHLVEFVNNMTHEFKTPLTTISLAGEALADAGVRASEEHSEKYTRMIRDESSRMRRQVEKILEIAALERGDCELNLSTVDLHDLVRTAVKRFSLLIKPSGGTISADLEASDHIISADQVHLENVLDNLLDNAVTYVRESPQIRIRTTSTAHTITLTVQDNGIGLTPEQSRQVFDSFYRVSTGDVHDVRGFGLGLSYAKLMVEAHGGTIRVQSAPGHGSTFRITLPTPADGTHRPAPDTTGDSIA